MDLQKMQNKDMDLALSTDAKPRLKWTPVLHQHFIEALAQLGGAERATPKSLMRVMGIPGLTLYHLKSHLQKYRLGKSQQSECCNGIEQEGCTENENGKSLDVMHTQMDESMHVAQTLQMQMEVQKKLHEQLEVQRHLQLRIESQGLYLQSILKKAQVALAGYNPSPAGLESAKTEVSELVSLVETRCFSSLFPEFTNTGCSGLDDEGKRSMRTTDCSDNSSITSTGNCGRKGEKQPLVENISSGIILCDTGLDCRLAGRKRSGSTISDESSMDHIVTRIPAPNQDRAFKLKKLGPTENLELNFSYQSKSVKVAQELDLNCAQPEVFDECQTQLGAWDA